MTGTLGRLRRWWLAPMPAQRLAMLRILVGGYAVVYLLIRFIPIITLARMPATQWKAVGPLVWCSEPVPVSVVLVVMVITVALGVGFVIGWRFRYTGPAFAIFLLSVLSYRNSWSMVFHTENLLVLHVIVLASAPAARVMSVGTSDLESEPHERYGWAVRLMGAVTVSTYVIAGWSKLSNSGWAWLTSDSLQVYVAYDNLRKIELGAGYSWLGGLMAQHGELFPPLAAVSLMVELGAPLALLHPRMGQAWAIVAWSFHLGVLVMMAIMFHYPLLGVAYAPFFPVERLYERWRRRAGRAGSWGSIDHRPELALQTRDGVGAKTPVKRGS